MAPTALSGPQLGIDVGDSGFEADWLVVDYEPLVEEKWSAFVTQYCDPAQPTTAVNSGPGRRRFEFMRRADMTRRGTGSGQHRLAADGALGRDTRDRPTGAARRLHVPGPLGADVAGGQRLPGRRRRTPHAPVHGAGPVLGSPRCPSAGLAPRHGAPQSRSAVRTGHVRAGTHGPRPGDHRRGGRRRAGHLRARPRAGRGPRRRAEAADGRPGGGDEGPAASTPGRAVAHGPEPGSRRPAGATGARPGRRTDGPVRRRRRWRLAARQPGRRPSARCSTTRPPPGSGVSEAAAPTCRRTVRCRTSTAPTTDGSPGTAATRSSPGRTSTSSRPVTTPTSRISSHGCARRSSRPPQKGTERDAHANQPTGGRRTLRPARPCRRRPGAPAGRRGRPDREP